MHDFLMYGTLRPGGRSYAGLLQGKTVYERPVTLLDYQMFAGDTYPYLLPGKGEVQATLVRLKSEVYSTLMKRFDQMEGYSSYKGGNNENDRILLKFDYEPDDEVAEAVFGQAWLYVTAAAKRARIEQLPRISDGDWLGWVKRKS